MAGTDAVHFKQFGARSAARGAAHGQDAVCDIGYFTQSLGDSTTETTWKREREREREWNSKKVSNIGLFDLSFLVKKDLFCQNCCVLSH